MIGFVAIIMMATAVVSFTEFPYDQVTALIAGNRFLGALIFAGLMCIATVVAPLTLLPLVPLVAPILGPFVTGMASTIGWLLGAVIAFLIARYGGRPLVARFVNLEAVNHLEARLPPDAQFLVLVVLRIVVPVDILSYALGLFSQVSLATYTLATLIGISWFSFAFAYLGEALFSGNYVLFLSLGVASVIVLGLAFIYLRRKTRSRD